MVKKELEVRNELGLHARVASKLSRCVQSYDCEVYAERNEKRYNLGSVLGVMTTGAKKGEVLQVIFEGVDEEAAALAVEKLFVEKFGER